MTLKVDAALRKDRTNAQATVKFEHRHFAFIAGVIASLVDTYDQPLDKADVAEAFAHALRDTNPRFDAQRFLTACDEGAS